ncbi:MAG: CoA-binding protein [Deltaproteobacteria bacterium]|nr:MAG: CoA-binding protein [Deltaproteobacteria bacterium]RLC17185.1 MAG: CoA-binding protein [Deltaproteobacteria bacterium]
MPVSISDSPLYKLINPDSIAFFGASNNFGSMGTSQLASLLGLGFEGNIYPVHPKEPTVLGLKAYQSVADLPETPDLAVIILPTRIVLDTVTQCGEKGIKNAIIVSGGFREVGAKGRDLEQTLIQTTHRYGMRFLGPNCLGVANPHHKLNTTFLPYQGDAGFLGMVSQSGSFITQMFDYLSRAGMGFSTAISVGNEADIDLVEGLKYLAACPHTKVINLYIETIRNPKKFIEVAGAVTLKKPVIAYYVGGSESGKQACLSHTGALSGPDRLYDGVFRQSGIIRAWSIEELFDMGAILGSVPAPHGDRVVIQTHSGGPGAVAADACDREGLKIPPMPDSVKKELSTLVPHTGSIGNPVDITFSKDRLAYFSSIPGCLLDADHFDILLIYLLLPKHMFTRMMKSLGVPENQIATETEKLIDELADKIEELVQTYGKPVIGFSFHSQEAFFIKRLRARNIPVMQSPHRAARAIAALCRYTNPNISGS